MKNKMFVELKNEEKCNECKRIKDNESYLSGIHSHWCDLEWHVKQKHYFKINAKNKFLRGRFL
jgi:hypothetical protein